MRTADSGHALDAGDNRARISNLFGKYILVTEREMRNTPRCVDGFGSMTELLFDCDFPSLVLPYSLLFPCAHRLLAQGDTTLLERTKSDREETSRPASSKADTLLVVACGG